MQKIFCKLSGDRFLKFRGYSLLFTFTGKDTDDLIAMGTIWSPNTQTPVKQIYSSTSGASSTTNSVTIRNVLTTSTQGSSSSTGIPQGSRGRYNIAGIKPIMVQTPKNIINKEGNQVLVFLALVKAQVSFSDHRCRLSVWPSVCPSVCNLFTF